MMAKASTVVFWGLALLCVAAAAPLESEAEAAPGGGGVRITKKEAEAAPEAIGGVRITKKEAEAAPEAIGGVRITKKEAEAAPEGEEGCGYECRIMKKEAEAALEEAERDGKIRITKKEAPNKADGGGKIRLTKKDVPPVGACGVGGWKCRITKKGEEDVSEDAFRAPPVVISKGKLRAYGTRCGFNIPPGMDKLKLGLDIANLDLVPKEAETADMGYKRPVFDYTCDEGKSVKIGADEYDLPDQIWDIARFPRGVMVENALIIKTSRDVQNSLAVNVGVSLEGAATEKGMFEGTASFDQMTSTLTQKNSNIEEVKTFVSAIRADMLPYWGSKPSRLIEMFIQKMPNTFEENPKKYHEFIKWFGTHYFMSAKFGGLIQMRLETNKDYYKTTSEQKIKANVDGTMRDLLKADGAINHGTNVIDDKFKQSTKNTIRYYGGDTNLLADKHSFPEWQPTIHGNPWLYGGELSSLADFFEEAPSKQQGFHKATRAHLDKVHAAALRQRGRRSLQLRREFGQVDSAAEINDIVRSLQDVEEDLTPDHQQLHALRSDLELALKK